MKSWLVVQFLKIADSNKFIRKISSDSHEGNIRQNEKGRTFIA